MLEQIISGGQTGVDQAALDVALELGIPCGGWCPRDRWSEAGPIDERYPLTESPSADPAERKAQVRQQAETQLDALDERLRSESLELTWTIEELPDAGS